MRYVVMTARVVKINTGATEKFAPRTSNCTRLHISGPYSGAKAAQAAVLAAMSVHTTLTSQVWAEDAIRDGRLQQIKVQGVWDSEIGTALLQARYLLDAADAPALAE